MARQRRCGLGEHSADARPPALLAGWPCVCACDGAVRRERAHRRPLSRSQLGWRRASFSRRAANETHRRDHRRPRRACCASGSASARPGRPWCSACRREAPGHHKELSGRASARSMLARHRQGEGRAPARLRPGDDIRKVVDMREHQLLCGFCGAARASQLGARGQSRHAASRLTDGLGALWHTRHSRGRRWWATTSGAGHLGAGRAELPAQRLGGWGSKSSNY
jgi:hypothetical protein